MTVDAELSVPTATAQLVRFYMADPPDAIMLEQEAYRIDLCLSPRPQNARACYRDHWAPDRFERMGSVFLLPPHQAVHTRSDGGLQTSIVCRLNPEPIHRVFDGDLEWTDRRLQASLDVSDANVRGLLLRLVEELRHPGFASQMLVELIVAQMAIELGRFCASITGGSSTGGLAPWRLRLIQERLQEVRKIPTLAELAELCRLSVRQLTRGFRESRGCSIGDYVANYQIDHAMRLLCTGQSVKSIAYSLGFASPSSFCFAFRRSTGQTPGQFRHQPLCRG